MNKMTYKQVITAYVKRKHPHLKPTQKEFRIIMSQVSFCVLDVKKTLPSLTEEDILMNLDNFYETL